MLHVKHLSAPQRAKRYTQQRLGHSAWAPRRTVETAYLAGYRAGQRDPTTRRR